MKRVSLRLTFEIWKELKEISEYRGLTMNSLINTIVYEYIRELKNSFK